MPTLEEIKEEARIRIAIAKMALNGIKTTITKARALTNHPNQQVKDTATAFLVHARTKALALVDQIDAP